MENLGLTFGQLSDLKNEIKKSNSLTFCINSPDFDNIFLQIVNSTIQKCKENIVK